MTFDHGFFRNTSPAFRPGTNTTPDFSFLSQLFCKKLPSPLLSCDDSFTWRYDFLNFGRNRKFGQRIDISQLGWTFAFNQLFSFGQFIQIRHFSGTCHQILSSPGSW